MYDVGTETGSEARLLARPLAAERQEKTHEGEECRRPAASRLAATTAAVAAAIAIRRVGLLASITDSITVFVGPIVGRVKRTADATVIAGIEIRIATARVVIGRRVAAIGYSIAVSITETTGLSRPVCVGHTVSFKESV
jgi:hypothetical protein